MTNHITKNRINYKTKSITNHKTKSTNNHPIEYGIKNNINYIKHIKYD